MRPEDLNAFIERLPALSAEGWHAALLARDGSLVPPLLPLVGLLPEHTENAAELMRAHLPVLAELPPVRDATDLPRPWAEQPLRQVERVVNALLAGQGQPSNAPPEVLGTAPDTAPLTAAARQHLAQAMGIAARWLQAASRSGAHADPLASDPAARAPWHGWLPPGPPGAACTLPVGLLDEAGQQGVPAELTLRLVPEPGARLCLVPAPASALLLRVGATWDETLASLRTQLLAELLADQGLPLYDTAIAWDLRRTDGQPLHTLEGPSAGASLALGALWLLRRAAPPHWRQLLLALEPRHLARCAFSAALGPGFDLLPVGGVVPKSEALLPLARALAANASGDAPLALGVSALQPLPPGATAPQPGQLALLPYANLQDAVAYLAREADLLTTAQQQLWDLLVVPGEAPPTLPPGLLKAVAEQPARSLRQYLLRCWAQCGRAMHESLHQRFVSLDLLETPLDVKADGLGPKKPLLLDGTGPYTSLHGMLQSLDDTLPQDGYLLRGKPGAGKSTLLRHHLQRAARRLLQRGAGSFQPTPADVGRPPPNELPVYLELNTLAAELDKTALTGWLRDRLHTAGPPELLALLAGRGSWARERGLRARVMLDGLNELRVPQASQRPQRAGDVVAALGALMQGQLPMLLSIRPQHAVALDNFSVLRVDVQDWTDSHIQAYLRLCLPGEDEAAFGKLKAVKGALALCSRPMHLAAQCELLAARLATPPGDRAALYNAWLWLRLRRALGCASAHENPRKPNEVWREDGPDHPDEVLLTAADRATLTRDDAWQHGPPRLLALQGQLLRSLSRQALHQWDADAEGGTAGSERTAGPHDWATVAPWLARPDDATRAEPEQALRRRFGRASRDLGLVQLDDGYATWQFDHQSWGEYLASCALLAADPPASPRLLQRLRLPDLPEDSDEAEIAALDRSAGTAWQAVPQQVWDELLRDGLHVRWEDFVNSRYNNPARDADQLQARGQQVRESDVASFDDGTLAETEADGTHWCDANLRQWGDTTGVAEALGLPSAHDWRNTDQAGAAGWQFLAQQRLYPIFQRALWAQLRPHLSEEQLATLQRQQGRLDDLPVPDGAEVLGLALLGLPQPRLQAWLLALLASEGMANAGPGRPMALWPALAAVLPALQARLEPAGAWGEGAAPDTPGDCRPLPDATLPHLRRVLLLHSLDAGAASLPGVRASGMLALLDAPPGPPPLQMPPELQAAWQRLRAAAFQGAGQRLRLRLKAGLLLGELGDNIRYQFRQPAAPGASPGLRPHPVLWAQVGPSWRRLRGRFRIGGGAFGDEQPAWTACLPGFLACRLPLTVGEWQWFQRSLQGKGWEWAMATNPDYNNPLQPVTGISWRAMQAYAAWANALWHDDGPLRPGRTPPRRRLALPTELQWEAAARGPRPGWLRRLLHRLWSPPASQDLAPPATHFNHANTRWLRPSPVGCFGRGINALGLADTLGNVWEFCANALTDAQRQRGWQQRADRDAANLPATQADDAYRALRGGAFGDAASRCRPSCRDHYHPDDHDYGVGVRLVRVWPPHSGH